jgi:phosphoglycolate phosphatase
MFRAVLFDFDGTLVDSYSAITASVNYVRQIRMRPSLEQNEVRKLVGYGLEQLMRDILPDSDPIENAKLYRAHHPSVMYTHTQLLPGVWDTLQSLHHKGIHLGVCSNKPSAITHKLIEALNLSSLFDAILGPEDSGEPKPHPRMLHLALEQMNIPISEALYIGDMTIDIQTARNANLPVWVVPTGSDDLETLVNAKPDRILKEMSELLPVLEQETSN